MRQNQDKPCWSQKATQIRPEQPQGSRHVNNPDGSAETKICFKYYHGVSGALRATTPSVTVKNSAAPLKCSTQQSRSEKNIPSGKESERRIFLNVKGLLGVASITTQCKTVSTHLQSVSRLHHALFSLMVLMV
ncbi:hypothetical protein J1605_013372 [Eschrichtius robustus]|uniref:E3 ubiquitin-protein ligase HECW1/2 N-terminal domain-containing protein n=1 Tax=Eschrichtius robustus TaxID=9764 RepID=A0AB34GJN0_ESCRO|nr:hypothetical protein J1605_013372 [Eschrichtius robustus]